VHKKAVFLDRDGTINEDVGYLYKKEDLAFIPGAIDAMNMLQEDFLLFIITNQQGISQGVFSEEDFLCFNEEFLEILKKNGINITEVFHCPHTKEENCICRKPKTFFIEKAAEKYCLDIKNSYMIGDHSSDIETGIVLDIKTIYLLSGHGREHIGELGASPDHIAEDLYRASLWINKQDNGIQDGK
jgi:D-glycero-D-manno-heptose 1,7-bisphosphate phosphatase